MVAVPRGRVIDIRTELPVAFAQVMIYDAAGKLHSTFTTNTHGEFSTTFPAGEYGLTVYAPGYALVGEAALTLPKTADVIYAGGTFVVNHDDEPIDMIVPVQSDAKVTFSLMKFVRTFLQTISFFIGKKIQKKNTSHGIIRDASTKQPLDLAVVRLFEQETGRLIATRISDIYGKFSLLPSSGIYRMTVTREGYEDSTRDHIAITATDDTALFAPVDLVQKTVL